MRSFVSRVAYWSLVALLVSAYVPSFAQANGDYRSVATGNWSDPVVWERFDAGAWAAATDYPGQNDIPATVTIQDAHTVSLDLGSTVTIGNLVVGSGVSGSFNTTDPAASLFVTGDLTIATGAAMTFSNTGSITVSGVTQVTGSFTTTTTGSNIFSGLVTVDGTWTSTTIALQSKLIFNGGLTNNGTFSAGGIRLAAGRTITANAPISISSGMDSPGDITVAGTDVVTISGDRSNIGRDLIVNGSIIFTGMDAVGVLDVTRNLIVNGSLQLASTTEGNAIVRGATTIAGSFSDTDNSGVDTFIGAVTVSASGTWNTGSVTSETNLLFRGGIQNNGTFSAYSASFEVNDQALSGTNAFTFAGTFSVAQFKNLTNNGTINLTSVAGNTLTGLGTFTQGINSTLNFSGSATIIVFAASATGNTVNYNGTNQTIFNTQTGRYYHLTVSNSGTKTLASNVDVLGNLTISGNAALKSDVQDITLHGDWINTSVNADPFIQDARTVSFDGTITQHIINTGNALGTTFFNLRFNNTSPTVPQIEVNADATVINSLTFNGGVINLNSNTLTLGENPVSHGTVTHDGTSNDGWLYNGTFTCYEPAGPFSSLFPVGTDSNFRPFMIASISDASVGGTISMRHDDSPSTNFILPPFMDNGYQMLLRHEAAWNVSTAGMVGGSYFIEGGGTGFGTIANINDLRLIIANSAVGDPGVNSGNTSAPRLPRYNVSLADLTNSFHVGSGNETDSPLPVSLRYFRAAGEGSQVYLSWATTTEINNAFFTIERSKDGKNFTEVGTVTGSGNSKVGATYSLWDDYPFSGRSYYRLKQTDLDGTVTSVAITTVNLKFEHVETLELYPVPSSGEVFVDLKGLQENQDVSITVVDAQGRVVPGAHSFTSKNGVDFSLNSASDLKPGIYMVRVVSAYKTHSGKIVIK